MALFYVPDKEEEYRPQGFTPSKTNRLNFLCADGWERTTAELPELTSAFHRYVIYTERLVCFR